MKIRIKGNSIRLRLSSPDVETFSKEKYLEEKTEFIDTILVYAISRYDGENMYAEFSGNRISIFVTCELFNQFVFTDVVGFEEQMPIGKGKYLSLLIEKDFKSTDEAYEAPPDSMNFI